MGGRRIKPPGSEQFFFLLDEVRRAQSRYQHSGHSRLAQRTSICIKAEGSALHLDDHWQANADGLYDLLKEADPISARQFRGRTTVAMRQERDRKIQKALKLLRFEPGLVTVDAHPDYFPTIVRAWADFRMDKIDESTGKPKFISDEHRKAARYRSLSNLSACYLIMRVGEGYRSAGDLLTVANASLAYPPAPLAAG